MLSSSDNPFARAASVEGLARAPEDPASRRGMDLEIEELRDLAEAARATDARFGLLLLPFRANAP